MHHNEDEWFYAIEGDYLLEVGSERLHLRAGDSILAPREVPHAWAFAGDTPGKLLIAFAPANKMEAFFRDHVKHFNGGNYANEAEIYRAYGMELLGRHFPWDENTGGGGATQDNSFAKGHQFLVH